MEGIVTLFQRTIKGKMFSIMIKNKNKPNLIRSIKNNIPSY